jgi:hypothetical protein
MSALTILLVRHAEKPGEDFPGPGLTPDGKKNDKSLVIRGWQRAGAWAALFALSPADYPRPNVVYAAKPEEDGDSKSARPFETSLPTADRLHLDVVTTSGIGDETKLVKEIVGLTGVVLVFWEHKAICAAIVPALLDGQEIPDVPTKWDGDRFDVALRFDRAPPKAPWSFRQLSLRLLSGDSDAPFKKRMA